MSQVTPKSTPRRMSLSAQKAMDFYVAESQKINDNEQNEMVKAARLTAQTHFIQTGFPSRRDEEWQYTPLTSFLQNQFSVKGISRLSEKDLTRFLPDFDVIRLVFVDGRFDDALSDSLSDLPKGLTIETTADLLEMADEEQQIILSAQAIEKEPFGLLNAMMFQDGFNIDVAKYAAIEMPVFVLHIQTQAEHASVLRNRVTLNGHAAFSLIESSVSLSSEISGFNNFLTEIDLGESASLKQLILQDESVQGYHFSNQWVLQSEKSCFETLYINLGAQVARHQNVVELRGEHCETNQNSICHGQATQVVDSRTSTLHALPEGQSRQLHKFVLRDKSRGVFNGMIHVAQDAQKTDGQMDNKNLLLSDDAKMDTKPQLEIYADDVKCSHGSASGQIDDDQIFYLQARGIRKPQAIQLITEAFLLEPLDMISRQNVKNWASKQVQKQLASVL